MDYQKHHLKETFQKKLQIYEVTEDKMDIPTFLILPGLKEVEIEYDKGTCRRKIKSKTFLCSLSGVCGDPNMVASPLFGVRPSV